MDRTCWIHTWDKKLLDTHIKKDLLDFYLAEFLDTYMDMNFLDTHINKTYWIYTLTDSLDTYMDKNF